MQLYVADYLGDTRHLTTEQHGAYLLLLMTMWRSDGVLSDDPSKLARIAGLTVARWKKISDDILEFFTPCEGGITQARLVAELTIADEKSEKRSKAGKAGGRAKALKDKKAGLANATRSSKHSPEPEPEKKEEAKASLSPGATPRPKARLYPEAFEAAWKAYPHHKGRSSKPNAAAVWAKLPADEREGMVAAIQRFAPNVGETCGGKGAPDMAGWLKDGKHLNWQGVDTDVDTPAGPTFNAPQVRASLVHASDEDFARRYVDHYCRWVPEGRRIEVRDPRVLPVLTGKLAAWATRNGVTIALMSANDSPPIAEEDAA